MLLTHPLPHQFLSLQMFIPSATSCSSFANWFHIFMVSCVLCALLVFVAAVTLLTSGTTTNFIVRDEAAVKAKEWNKEVQP